MNIRISLWVSAGPLYEDKMKNSHRIRRNVRLILQLENEGRVVVCARIAQPKDGFSSSRFRSTKNMTSKPSKIRGGFESEEFPRVDPIATFPTILT